MSATRPSAIAADRSQDGLRKAAAPLALSPAPAAFLAETSSIEAGRGQDLGVSVIGILRQLPPDDRCIVGVNPGAPQALHGSTV